MRNRSDDSLSLSLSLSLVASLLLCGECLARHALLGMYWILIARILFLSFFLWKRTIREYDDDDDNKVRWGYNIRLAFIPFGIRFAWPYRYAAARSCWDGG